MFIHVDKVGMLVGSEAQKNSVERAQPNTVALGPIFLLPGCAWLTGSYKSLNPFLGLGPD